MATGSRGSARGGEGEPRKPLKEGSRKVGVLGLENDLRLVSGDLRWFCMVLPVGPRFLSEEEDR